MSSLWVFIAKDLRRAFRNPIPWVIFLAMPLVITALIGLAFGPKSGEKALGRIRFALVDEDDSALTRLLLGGLNQGQANQYFEPLILNRAEAMFSLNHNKISAVLVIPRDFTRHYLVTTNVVRLELIKNPAQSIHPAVLEELLAAAVTGLDAVKQHLATDLPEWLEVVEGRKDYRRIAELIVQAGDRVQVAKPFLFPPRVVYSKAQTAGGEAQDKGRDANQAQGGAGKAPAAFSLFGYLLAGLAAMFLLFLGNNAMKDIRTELAQGTLARIHTLHHRLYSYVAGKVLFSLVALLICAGIMLGGGSAIFRIHWVAPGKVVALVIGYCAFAAGFMALMGSLVGRDHRSEAFTNVVAMVVGLAGGGAFPAQQLPDFLRQHITPWLPNHWFTEQMRLMLGVPGDSQWALVAAQSFLLGLALSVLAAWFLQRKLEKGAL